MIIVLGLLVALGPLTIDMYLPALPKIADELSLSSSVAQLTLTGTLAGLALGQLIVGPLSDSLGRKKPLIAGILLHMAASLLCLFASNIAVLGIARGLQGVGAAAAMVVAIAVVGDLFADSVAATVMSRLMLVLGVAPVVAPSLGAAVLLHASWHWVFAALVVLAGALLVMAVLALPETLAVDHRRPLKVRGILATYLELVRDVRFVILVLVAALGMSGLFAYISGASFVLQGGYGLSQGTFALVFGAGAIALIGSTQFNVVLLRRFPPQQIMVWALFAASVSGLVFVGLATAGHRWAAGIRRAGVGDPGCHGTGDPQRTGGGAHPPPRRRGDRRGAARRGPVRSRRRGRARRRCARQRRVRDGDGDGHRCRRRIDGAGADRSAQGRPLRRRCRRPDRTRLTRRRRGHRLVGPRADP